MSSSLTRLSIPLLRWTLAIVVIGESVQFISSASAARMFAAIGMPSWVRPALGIAEILAAILFLVPRTTVVGAYFLMLVFGLAAIVHLLHGQYGIGGLVVYAAAALVCVPPQSNSLTEVHHE